MSSSGCPLNPYWHQLIAGASEVSLPSWREQLEDLVPSLTPLGLGLAGDWRLPSEATEFPNSLGALHTTVIWTQQMNKGL